MIFCLKRMRFKDKNFVALWSKRYRSYSVLYKSVYYSDNMAEGSPALKAKTENSSSSSIRDKVAFITGITGQVCMCQTLPAINIITNIQILFTATCSLSTWKVCGVM